MKAKKPLPFDTFDPFENKVLESKYVAYIDILGFGALIQRDFKSTLILYQNLMQHWRSFCDFSPDISLRILSDSIILSSSKLGPIVKCVNVLCMATLSDDLLIRGGIAFGKHIDNFDEGNLYILSEALTEAVYIEKQINFPCVVFSKSIEIPEFIWNLKCNNINRPVLHFDGVNLVNPFNLGWGQSAEHRVLQLLEKYPEYHIKYEWFLSLYKAVFSKKPLIPY
jgi:hypothetical protein